MLYYPMVLSDCEIIEAEFICLIIDKGSISNEVCMGFMETTYHTNYEMFVLRDWMLMRWVLLREPKFHLPKRRRTSTVLNLTN